jgi:hypothetical protein
MIVGRNSQIAPKLPVIMELGEQRVTSREADRARRRPGRRIQRGA